MKIGLDRRWNFIEGLVRMRNLLLSAVVGLIGLSLHAAVAPGLKIGVIDFQKAIEGEKVAQQTMKTIEEQEKVLNETQQAIEKEMGELQQASALGKISAAEVEKKRKAMQPKIDKFMEDRRKQDTSNQKEQERLMNQNIILLQHEAKQGNFDLVVRKEAVLYSNDKIIDMTDKHIVDFNKAYQVIPEGAKGKSSTPSSKSSGPAKK